MVSDSNNIEFSLRLTFTIILLLAQLLIALYLLIKINIKKKERGRINFDFLFSFFILMICLSISLIIYAYFNFNLTHFDPSNYHLYPYVFVWKLGSLISFIGYTVVLYIIDKDMLEFRMKGILAYIVLLVAIIQFLWPVSQPEDFEFIATLGIVGNIVAIVIPINFFYIGKKTLGLRLAGYMIALGVLVYAIGSTLLVETIVMRLEVIFGTEIRVFLYILSLSLNIIGLILAAYGVVKFSF
jgi:hypothetical protein